MWFITGIVIGAIVGAGGVAFLAFKYKKQLEDMKARFDAVTGNIPG